MSISEKIDKWAILLSLIIIRFPSIFSGSLEELLKIVSILVLWVFILKNYFLHIRTQTGLLQFRLHRPRLALLFLSLIGLIGLSYIRGVSFELISVANAGYYCLLWGSLSLLLITIFFNKERQNKLGLFREYVLLGLFIYIMTACVLQIVLPASLYIKNETTAIMVTTNDATMLGLMGVSAFRTFFPMTDGFIPFGPVAASMVLIGIFAKFSIFRIRFLNRALNILVLGCGVYAILRIDARFATLSMILSILIIKFVPKYVFSYFKYAIFVLPFMPAFLMSITTLLTQIGPLQNLSRHDSDLSTISGRTPVWEVVIEDILKQPDEKLFGYGMNGHVISGISGNYYNMNFLQTSGSNITSMHNSIFQLTYDIGYIGIALYLILWYATIQNLALSIRFAVDKRQRNIALSILAILIFLMADGILNNSMTPHNDEMFSFIIMLMIAILPTVEVYKVRRRISIIPKIGGSNTEQ